MADERVDSEIVSRFLLNTCRLRPRLTKHALWAAAHCAYLTTRHSVGDVEADFIPLITGSVDEFYIEPMLPHIGDIDVMRYRGTWLAIPRERPPPTQLPAEFHNYVKVVEIVDSHIPGYVYLETRYLLTYCTDDEKYHYVEYDDREWYIVISNDPSTVRHGPAVFTDNSGTSQLSVDAIYCCRCLVWPSQAADWPARQKNYDWPDSATVERVVGNGCDIVQVAHRQCRQHVLMSKFQ